MHARTFPLLPIVCASCLLAGCSNLQVSEVKSALPTNAQAPSSAKANEATTQASAQREAPEQLVPAAARPINLTPLSTYTDEWTGNAPQGASFSDAYTRVVISSDLPGGGDKSASEDIFPLPYTQRSWWLRALVGEEFSVNLTAKITIGAFETTVPLATIGHQSSSAGEQWSRAIYHSKASLPLFLVKADGSASIPTIKLSVNGSRSYSSRGAATAVQVALGVARATGQPASVITRLTEQTTKDQARAIDDAISRLFASGIAEEHWTDRDLKLWSVTDDGRLRGVKVRFNMPRDEQNWNSDYSAIGTWTISFDYPRPSIFSDWRVCATDALARCSKTRRDAEANVYKEIDKSEVLNFVLVNGASCLGTIRAYISQQDWYVSAQVALTNTSTANAAASSLCRRIANEIAGLGLNGFDARIVAWAIANGMPLPTGVTAFPEVDDCKMSKTVNASDKQ